MSFTLGFRFRTAQGRELLSQVDSLPWTRCQAGRLTAQSIRRVDAGCQRRLAYRCLPNATDTWRTTWRTLAISQGQSKYYKGWMVPGDNAKNRATYVQT